MNKETAEELIALSTEIFSLPNVEQIVDHFYGGENKYCYFGGVVRSLGFDFCKGDYDATAAFYLLFKHFPLTAIEYDRIITWNNNYRLNWKEINRKVIEGLIDDE